MSYIKRHLFNVVSSQLTGIFGSHIIVLLNVRWLYLSKNSMSAFNSVANGGNIFTPESYEVLQQQTQVYDQIFSWNSEIPYALELCVNITEYPLQINRITLLT
jgi:hypothetical protein